MADEDPQEARTPLPANYPWKTPAALTEAQLRAKGDALEWAVSRWLDEVSNRPLANVHRRTLDDTWRQVIRHFGGDPDALVGPSHDALIAARPEAK